MNSTKTAFQSLTCLMMIFIADFFTLDTWGSFYHLARLFLKNITFKDNAYVWYAVLPPPVTSKFCWKKATLIKYTRKAGLRCDLPLTSSKPAWLRDLLLTDKSPTFEQPLQNLIENVMPLSQVPLEGDSTLGWVMWKIGHWRLNSPSFSRRKLQKRDCSFKTFSLYVPVIFGQDSNVKIDLTKLSLTLNILGFQKLKMDAE